VQQKETRASQGNCPDNGCAEIDGVRCHKLLAKDTIGKQQRQGGREGDDNNSVFPPAMKQSEKNIKNTTISRQNGGGGHVCLLVSRLAGVGLARNKAARVEQWAQERGRETSIIDDDEGEADKMATMGVVVIGRDTAAVASVRGTKFEYKQCKEKGVALQQWRKGGEICDKIGRKMTRRQGGVCRSGGVRREATDFACSQRRRSRHSPQLNTVDCCNCCLPPLWFGEWQSIGGIEWKS
jgi:hypothetical protein